MTTSVSICLLVILACLAFGEALKYCEVNSDCSELGQLICVKSQCKWGMCGCGRGYVSRYIGSEKLFRCVPQKKIGEGCSTDQDSGVCGPPNSYCRNGTCSCKDGDYPIFGGEMCDSGNRDLYPGEMMSGDSSNILSPLLSGMITFSSISGFDPREILDWNPAAAVCNPGSTLTLPNMFHPYIQFQGKKMPICRAILVGETCITDADCSGITGAVTHCLNNKCACKTTNYGADVTKEACVSTAAADLLTHGVNCTNNVGSSLGTCNPASGLRCGDVCSSSDAYPSESAVKKCACHPYYITSGSTCTARAIGSECHGDNNCKGVNMNAICVEGKCQNAAKILAPAMTLILLCLAWMTL